MSSFESMDLLPSLKRVLAELNYETPTPIQAQTIPAAVDGKDILGCAQTGTGKTAAFALPILDFLGHDKPRAKPNRPTVLVMAPTRELAIQIGESFRTYGRHVRFRQALVYGGVSQVGQVRSLRAGVDVLVATPGRLLDLMDQGHVDLREVEILVLDEADRMLDMGFLPELKKIIAKLPEERQSLFFSATMPPKIRELSGRLLFNPVSVDVTPRSRSVKKINQKVNLVEKANKLPMLRELLGGGEVERAIVFTRTKRGANALVNKLDRSGICATAIHGNKSQGARQKALDAFRKKRVTVLVATDVAARGIDIDGVTHVVNYDMPCDAESYVHRIGRTGRAGAAGTAISFCTPQEHGELRAIEKLIGQRLTSGRLESNSKTEPPSRGPRKNGGGNKRKRGRGQGGKTPIGQGSRSRRQFGKPSRRKATMA